MAIWPSTVAGMSKEDRLIFACVFGAVAGLCILALFIYLIVIYVRREQEQRARAVAVGPTRMHPNTGTAGSNAVPATPYNPQYGRVLEQSPGGGTNDTPPPYYTNANPYLSAAPTQPQPYPKQATGFRCGSAAKDACLTPPRAPQPPQQQQPMHPKARGFSSSSSFSTNRSFSSNRSFSGRKNADDGSTSDVVYEYSSV